MYGIITLFDWQFQTIPLHMLLIIPVLQPPTTDAVRFGLVRVRSPLLTESLLFSSPPGT